MFKIHALLLGSLRGCHRVRLGNVESRVAAARHGHMRHRQLVRRASALAVVLAIAGCAPRAMPVPGEHPANPNATPGRLAGPPAALRPGVASSAEAQPPAPATGTVPSGSGHEHHSPAVTNAKPELESTSTEGEPTPPEPKQADGKKPKAPQQDPKKSRVAPKPTRPAQPAAPKQPEPDPHAGHR